jgi:hypothetical protein
MYSILISVVVKVDNGIRNANADMASEDINWFPLYRSLQRINMAYIEIYLNFDIGEEMVGTTLKV